MYIELGHEAAIKVVKQLVNELHYGKPNFLSKLAEASSILSVLNYEMDKAAREQEIKQ